MNRFARQSIACMGKRAARRHVERVSAGVCAFALIQTALVSAATYAAGPTVVLDIRAADAPQALRQFYLQSRVRVLYLSDTVKGIRTQAVHGQLEASAALAQMLEGTGLTYEFEGDYSAVVKPAPEAQQLAAKPAAAVSEIPAPTAQPALTRN